MKQPGIVIVSDQLLSKRTEPHVPLLTHRTSCGVPLPGTPYGILVWAGRCRSALKRPSIR